MQLHIQIDRLCTYSHFIFTGYMIFFADHNSVSASFYAGETEITVIFICIRFEYRFLTAARNQLQVQV